MCVRLCIQKPFKFSVTILQSKKMKEETRGTKPFRSIVVAASVADPNEKEHIVSLLMSMPHSRSEADVHGPIGCHLTHH